MGLHGHESWLTEHTIANFIRISFDPETMRIVVFLGAERKFDRFLDEHVGLGKILETAAESRGTI